MSTYFARSACPYDCPDTCGLLVETDGTTVLRVKGDPDHPVTRGFLCQKMQRYDLSINHPGRILHPMRRTGAKGAGQFSRISWDEALDAIAGTWRSIIAEHGPEAILPYSYSGVMSAIHRNCGIGFFNYMGGSSLVRTICASAKRAAWISLMGATGDLDPRDLAHSDMILIWGSDVTVTRLHSVPHIKAARKRGAPVLLLETYKGPTAGLCDETILIRPGADGVLALAMMSVMAEENLADREFLAAKTLGWETLEADLPAYAPEKTEAVTGVPAETVRRLARMYAKASAPAIILGSGPSRNRAGGKNCRCVALLPAVAGVWGKPGGGTAGFGPANPSPLDINLIARPDFRKQPGRSINMNQLSAALADPGLSPPLKSLFIFCANPVTSTGNQTRLMEQLGREDLFVVVQERFLTDTARFADILLPGTFSVEQGDIHTCYGYATLQTSKAVVPPPGECKSPWMTFQALARHMGYDDPYFRRSEEEMVRHVLEESPGLRKILTDQAWDDLVSGRGIDLPRSEYARFGTPSGRIEICSGAVPSPLPVLPAPLNDGWPLRLVAAPSPYTLNSTFSERQDLVEKRGPMTLVINDADARARGIAHGDQVVCFNEQARVEYTAHVTDGVMPGTVVAHGVYRPGKTHNGLTTNALLRERLSDMGEATTLNDNGVDVQPLPAAS